MTHHFRVLIEVGEGAIRTMGPESFTSREFGQILHESMQYLPKWDRYPKPLRRGHTAGWVLHHLSKKGLVVKAPRPGRWQPL